MTINDINSEIYRLLDKPFQPCTAPFSNFFLVVVEVIENFVKSMSIYLRGIYDFDGKIFIQTRDFLSKIDGLFASMAREGKLALAGLATLSNDIVKLQSLSNYFLNYIQKRTENNFSFEINLLSIFESTKNQIDSRIHAEYPISLSYHLKNFLSVKWMEKKQTTAPKKFVVELGHFLKTTLREISDINYAIGVSLAYLSYREINKAVSELFVHHVKTFNIVDIANLEQDLKYLDNIADEDFFHLDKLKETLSQITQFVQLFLDFNPLSYKDASLRQSKFYSLGPQFLVKVLPKYRKFIAQGLPVVRKRECKEVCDFISDQLIPKSSS